MKIKNKTSIEKYCKYCELATPLASDDEMICEIHGVVSSGYVFKKFVYDPLKRLPKRVTLKKDDLEFPDLDSEI